MTSLKGFGILSMVCKRSFFVKHVTRKKILGFAFMHNSSICLDVGPIEIKMPSLSPTMTEGTIVKWLKKEGDTISPGDVLCEIQTDKAIVGLETEEEGVLTKILVPEDTKNITLGEVIAIIMGEGGTSDVVMKSVSIDCTVPVTSDGVKTTGVSQEDIPRLCGPSVRKLLQEYGIKYSLVTSTGPQNNLLKGDVLKYIRNNNLKLQQPHVTETSEVSKAPDVTFIEKHSFVDIPLTSMRKTIARRLTESKTMIPHAYASTDCNIDKLLTFRKDLKEDGINVSVNDFVIKCAAVALSKLPNVNVINVNGVAQTMPSVDISVAVATENGLITPIIKDANNLNIQNISQAVKALATKAREGKLKPEEFQGGSFTISNLGMFGISEFSAVINPPQGAILAVGGGRLAIEEGHSVQKMTVTLSFDSRIIGDSDAGKFLQSFKMYLENPLNIIL